DRRPCWLTGHEHVSTMVSGQVVEGQYRATAPSADPNPPRRWILAPAIREPPHAREQFGEGDGRDRDAPRERSEPIDDSSLRRRPEDLRDHVRIEDDHPQPTALATSSRAGIGRPSTPPTSWAAASSAIPTCGRRAALVRMSRT